MAPSPRATRIAHAAAAAGLRLVLVAAALLVGGPAGAQVVYKCRDADGGLSYRDSPCPRGSEELSPPRLDPPPRDAGYVPGAPDASSAPRTADRADTGTSRAPAPPPPALYRCTRYDGQQSYVTSDGRPRRYQVPLWTVLPEMVGTRAGGATMGRPRGGTDARRAAVLGAYTWVEDRCYRMSRGEVCAHWAERRDQVASARRTAFNDTRPGLDAEHAQLRSDRDAYCR